MAATATHDDPAREAYDALAFAYDAFTAGFAHDEWLRRLERLARDHGLQGRRVLDVACGTGKSFVPLLRCGYDVTGCDVSERMLARAARKAPQVRLLRTDMRELPEVGAFDLVTCLDDALNYLHDERGLAGAFAGIRRNLAPGGIAIWDVNTLRMYRTDFASEWRIEREGLTMVWRGATRSDLQPGGRAAAVVEVFGGDGALRASSRHDQRHWPAAAVAEIAAGAGLDVRAVHGQHRGARLDGELDESLHTKAVFVAVRDGGPRPEEVRAVRIGSP